MLFPNIRGFFQLRRKPAFLVNFELGGRGSAELHGQLAGPHGPGPEV